MTLDALGGRLAGVVVSGRIELEAEAPAERLIALGPNLGTGPSDCEVDIEEDGLEHHR